MKCGQCLIMLDKNKYKSEKAVFIRVFLNILRSFYAF